MVVANLEGMVTNFPIIDFSAHTMPTRQRVPIQGGRFTPPSDIGILGGHYEAISKHPFRDLDHKQSSTLILDMLLREGAINRRDYNHAMSQPDTYDPRDPPVVSTHGVCKFSYETADGQRETVILKEFDNHRELQDEIDVSEVFSDAGVSVAGYTGGRMKMHDKNGKTVHFGVKKYDESGDQTKIDASQGSLDVFTKTVEDVLASITLNSDAIIDGLHKKRIKVRKAKDGHMLRSRFYDESGTYTKDDKQAVDGFISLIDATLQQYGKKEVASAGDVRDANLTVSGKLLDLEPRSQTYTGIDMELRSEAHDLTYYMISLMTYADRDFTPERRAQIRSEMVGAYQQRTGLTDAEGTAYINDIVDLELIKNGVTKIGDHIQRAFSGEDDVETRMIRAKKSLEIALETIDEKIATGYEHSAQLETFKASVLNQIMESQDDRMKSLQDYVSNYLNPVQPIDQINQMSREAIPLPIIDFSSYRLPVQPMQNAMPIILFTQNLAS
tara:strand:+ start:5943 stop:7439 length:1497 start_codon:yes stop_codon:yes gene_type:complete